MLSSVYGDRLYAVLPRYYLYLNEDEQKYARLKEQWRTASEKYRNKVKRPQQD